MYLRSLQWRVLRSVQKSAAMERNAYRDWVATGLLRQGKSKGGLAKVLGIHQSQITRLLDGARQLKAEEVPVVARYLESVPPDMEIGLAEGPPQFDGETPPSARTVKVIGYVGAGNQPRVFYGNSQGDFDEVPAPEDSTPATVAVEVRGESLGLMFDRWVVFYDEVRRPVTSDLIGKLCVVGLPDESVLVKKIRKGRGGLYRLFSEREAPIENVEIEWAARVKHMAPR